VLGDGELVPSSVSKLLLLKKLGKKLRVGPPRAVFLDRRPSRGRDRLGFVPPAFDVSSRNIKASSTTIGLFRRMKTMTGPAGCGVTPVVVVSAYASSSSSAKSLSPGTQGPSVRPFSTNARTSKRPSTCVAGTLTLKRRREPNSDLPRGAQRRHADQTPPRSPRCVRNINSLCGGSTVGHCTVLGWVLSNTGVAAAKVGSDGGCAILKRTTAHALSRYRVAGETNQPSPRTFPLTS